jgi:hypothetical protein
MRRSAWRRAPSRAATLLATLALLTGLVPAHAVAAEPPCYADWSDAAPVVARERLVAASEMQELARRRLAGELVRITLCRLDAGRGGEAQFVYRIVMRDGRGRITNMTVDARRPFERQSLDR